MRIAGLGYQLPSRNSVYGKRVREQLQRIGLLRSSGHEHFTGSLIIPVIDQSGNVKQVYGRKVSRDTKLRKGTALHLYLPGPHVGVFNHSCLAAYEEIILCESLIDALTFIQAGYENVTTTYGANGLTDELIESLQAHRVRRLLLAYDRDSAGDQAAMKHAQRFKDLGIESYRIELPKGMDANEYSLNVQPADKALGVVIRSAVLLESVGRSIDSSADLAASDLKQVVDSPLAPVTVDIEQAVEAEVSDTEVTIKLGDRDYRVRGLEKNTSYEVLKVNLLVRCGDGYHVDVVDLYQAKPREGYIRCAASELKVKESILKTDMGKVLLKLEGLQEDRLKQSARTEQSKTLSAEEHRAAMRLLKTPDLLAKIKNDVEALGIVGETSNALVAYLGGVSRKLSKPLAVLIQSSSAAGKSSLMDAVLSLMPEEERVQYSAMTGQSLYYMGSVDLQHKILAIAEEEGAHQASYALKLLHSEGEISIASTGKDPQTGRLETQAYTVQGPVQLLMTTTALEIDEELLNRCVVLSVNESREQTQAIHDQQRYKRTLEGLLQQHSADDIKQLHQNAQSLLKPLSVVNPYADQLTFVSSQTRMRRDHEKYLTLIDAMALLHQHQREIHSIVRGDTEIEYIEVELPDIEQANQLAHEVLGRTLDELPPQTRRLLGLIYDHVQAVCSEQQIEQNAYRFSRKFIRDVTGWGDTQLKVHLSRLAELEYVLIHRGGRGQSFEYELCYQGENDNGTGRVLNLLDVEKLNYDAPRSGLAPGRSAPGRGVVGPQSGGGRDDKNGAIALSTSLLADEGETRSTIAIQGVKKSASHRRVQA